ncbi:ABC transporter substrate-binding protein [Rivibacter subsaxonicus]|uniref:Amino acid/amide ABC transporter substrate-binding protein (HAAT family) n=1 Tax=Rivibacter subsaxonicus TaxID=457575 RepID=A0A4Q7VGL0_9BURK|nr:ABC transporter substrate-binding protein [Rivibacter subsaxonicus]RZT95137.1 amino acid/amide ABC transporter substrate-binding protein (HAAT family) [Rivibacter subsaxonicus]
MLQRRHLLHGAAAAAAASLGLPALAQTGDRRIVLGQSAPLTGAAAQLGLQFQRGARLAFERSNARGGVAGAQIELRTLDDGYEPERCKANTTKLIKDGVFALFGYIGTPTSLAALPLASEADVPFFAPFTGAQALREPFNRNVFHVRASYFDETARIVNQLASTGFKRIAVFHQNDSYGQAGLAGVKRAMEPLSLLPVAVATVERNSVDVEAALKTLLAAQPDAVIQVSAYRSCAAFIRGARKAGYGGQFYNVSFVGTQALADELGPDARGVVVSQVMPYPFAPVGALAGEYLQALAATGADAKPDYSSMEGYVAARVLLEGLRRGGTGRESFVAGLEGMRDVDLGGFRVDFGARKHTGSSFVELTILGADGRVRR